MSDTLRGNASTPSTATGTRANDDFNALVRDARTPAKRTAVTTDSLRIAALEGALANLIDAAVSLDEQPLDYAITDAERVLRPRLPDQAAFEYATSLSGAERILNGDDL